MILGCQAFSWGETPKAVSLKVCAHLFLHRDAHDGSGNSNLTELLGQWSGLGNLICEVLEVGKDLTGSIQQTPLGWGPFFNASKKCFENARVPAHQTL